MELPEDNILREQDVQALLDKWIPRLGLTEWKIIAVIEDSDPSEYAHLGRLPDMYRAKITINRSFYTGKSMIDVPHLERTIVHELMHICIGHYAGSVEDTLSNVVGGREGSALVQRYRDEEERFVDRLSLALVKEWEHEDKIHGGAGSTGQQDDEVPSGTC